MARDEKKCPQCAEAVKVEARVCRFCGFHFPPNMIKKRPISVPAGCLTVLLLAIVIGALSQTHSSNHGSATSVAAAPPSPAENLRTGTAMAAGRHLREAMRNPDSLVIESAVASDDGKLLCVRYRAQNGFGGMNRDAVAWLDGTPHQGASFWNKHCLTATNDVSYVVEEGAKL